MEMIISANVIFIVLGIVVVWCASLTLWFLRLTARQQQLMKGGRQASLQDIVSSLLQGEKALLDQIRRLDHGLQKIESAQQGSFQKLGIIRFNPFADTGGNQSFTIALLDGANNGLVLTSLYARNTSRWYSKEVRLGKGKDAALSKEEEMAIAQSQSLIAS